MTPAARQWTRRIGAVALLVVAAVGVDRLTHLPASTAIVDDRKWGVPVGHRLELTGPETENLLRIETGSGDGAQLRAGPSTFAGADGKAVKSLVWQVGGLADQKGDSKVLVDVAIAGAPDADDVIFVRRSGSTTRPELQIGSPNAALSVRAGVVIGDYRVMPAATLTADGNIQKGSLQTAFTIAPGGDLRLTFPAFADGTPKGMTVTLGEDTQLGPRLWLRRIGIVADGEAIPWKAACAAPAGRQLWPMVWRGSATFEASDCASGELLAATSLEIGREENISLSMAGSAYRLGRDQPEQAPWFNWLRNNLILGLALTAALGTWVARMLRTILGAKKGDTTT